MDNLIATNRVHSSRNYLTSRRALLPWFNVNQILELIVVNSRRDGKLIMTVVYRFLKEPAVTNVNEPCYRSNFRRPILNCNR